jgi:hypothetical protein
MPNRGRIFSPLKNQLPSEMLSRTLCRLSESKPDKLPVLTSVAREDENSPKCHIATAWYPFHRSAPSEVLDDLRQHSCILVSFRLRARHD